MPGLCTSQAKQLHHVSCKAQAEQCASSLGVRADQRQVPLALRQVAHIFDGRPDARKAAQLCTGIDGCGVWVGKLHQRWGDLCCQGSGFGHVKQTADITQLTGGRALRRRRQLVGLLAQSVQQVQRC